MKSNPPTNNLITCKVTLREVSYSFSENDELDLLDRVRIYSASIARVREEKWNNFIRLINLVVENGGVIPFANTMIENNRLNIYEDSIVVKIPESRIEIIKTHSSIESLEVI